ncbi:MAG: hypothetical protein IJZ26_02880 [Clostridia bacterium]|nr:hypothetical protein [Clostridia bacterium]
MISILFLSGAVLILWIWLISFNLKHKPKIYKNYKNLKPKVINSLSRRMLLFTNTNFNFYLFNRLGLVIKTKQNQQLRMYFCDDNFSLQEPFEYYITNYVLCTKHSIKNTKLFVKWGINSLLVQYYALHTTYINLKIDRQNVNYYLLENKIKFVFNNIFFELEINNEFKILQHKDFLILKLKLYSGSNNFEIKFSKINGNKLMLKQLINKEKKLWAYCDIKKFDNKPNFKNLKSKENLQTKYAMQCIEKCCNQYSLITEDIFLKSMDFVNYKLTIKNSVIINLSKLGFSKFCSCTIKKDYIYLKDVLTGNFAKIKIVGEYNACKLNCFWGYMCLVVKTQNLCVLEYMPFELDFVNLVAKTTIKTNSVSWYNKININESVLYNTVFCNLNRFILMGQVNNIDKILKNLILENLNPKNQFEILNCILSLIKVTENASLLNNTRISKLLIKNLLGIKSLDYKTYCYIKKIMPFLKNVKIKKHYFNLLNSKLELKNECFEYWFVEFFGINLLDNGLRFMPNGEINNLELKFLLKNSNINIVLDNGRNVVLNDVKMLGFNYFVLEPNMNIVYN